MTGSSLGAAYFDGIFEHDEDPWDLASSNYEAAKFAHTHNVLAERRYTRALEIGCAHGVLTGILAGLCDTLLSVDISTKALAKARVRVGDRPGVTFQSMAFPQETPTGDLFDLVILSEVAYYWSSADLARAAEWLGNRVFSGGRIILVHYVGKTDYPQSGESAVAALWEKLQADFSVEQKDRRERYRLDLWRKN